MLNIALGSTRRMRKEATGGSTGRKSFLPVSESVWEARLAFVGYEKATGSSAAVAEVFSVLWRKTAAGREMRV